MQATVTTLPELCDSATTLIDELRRSGVPIHPSSRLAAYQRELIKAVPSTLGPTGDQMRRWHRTLIEVNDLFTIVQQLSKPPAISGWEQRTREALSGSFLRSEDSKNTRARNTQFELVLAASFRSAGYEPKLEEPDVVVTMSVGRVGVAAKRPSSATNLGHTIRDAGRQIGALKLPGLIAVDATVLINPEDSEITTSDFEKEEARVASHAIDVAKRFAAIAGDKVGTEYVFGVMVRACVPIWEPHIPRMSFVERWPVVSLVGENDIRYQCCRDLAVNLRGAGAAS